MLSFYVALIVACVPTSFEEASKKLFENWGTTLHVPEITIGVPTKDSLEESTELTDQIYDQCIKATQGELTVAQRELDVPFAMGMIEGIRAAQGNKNAAELCLGHLSELDGAVSGLSASRLLRMRLHALDCLGRHEEALECAESINEMKSADIEDQLVAALRSEQVDGYTWDSLLASRNRNDLRWFFACGVVEQQPSNLELLFGVANDLVARGVERRVIDLKLVGLLERLDPPIAIVSSSEQKGIALVAQRAVAHDYLEQNKFVLAKEKLLELMQSGCAFSAQQLLTTPEIKLQLSEVHDAIELVLQQPTETSYDYSYWQLFAGSHFASEGNIQKAGEHLHLVSVNSGYYDDAQELRKLLRGSDVGTLQNRIRQAAISGKSVAGIVAEIQPMAAQTLLQEYVDLWHTVGIEENPWLPKVVVALLEKTSLDSPYLLGEANRLLGRLNIAKKFFERSSTEQGVTLHVAIGLADCNRDPAAMQRVARGLVLGTKNNYWYWLAHSRMIRWYCEDGGNKMKAHAKVNRLKQLDPTLGGEQFASVFREALQ